MPQSPSELYSSHATQAVQSAKKWLWIVSAIGFGLYAAVLNPLYTQLDSNVTYQESFITYVLYYLLHGVEIAVFFAAFAATVYAIWRVGFAKSSSVWVAYHIVTVAKFLVNFVMDCIMDGSIPSLDFFFNRDLPKILPLLLLELAQYWGVILIAVLAIRGKKRKWQMDVLLDGDQAGDERSLAFPITKLFGLKNPVQAASFGIALFFGVVRVLMHLYYQLVLLVYTNKTDGALIITVDMISDVALALVAYLVMIWLLSSFDKKEITELADTAEESVA